MRGPVQSPHGHGSLRGDRRALRGHRGGRGRGAADRGGARPGVDPAPPRGLRATGSLVGPAPGDPHHERARERHELPDAPDAGRVRERHRPRAAGPRHHPGGGDPDRAPRAAPAIRDPRLPGRPRARRGGAPRRARRRRAREPGQGQFPGHAGARAPQSPGRHRQRRRRARPIRGPRGGREPVADHHRPPGAAPLPAHRRSARRVPDHVGQDRPAAGARRSPRGRPPVCRVPPRRRVARASRLARHRWAPGGGGRRSGAPRADRGEPHRQRGQVLAPRRADPRGRAPGERRGRPQRGRSGDRSRRRDARVHLRAVHANRRLPPTRARRPRPRPRRREGPRRAARGPRGGP